MDFHLPYKLLLASVFLSLTIGYLSSTIELIPSAFILLSTILLLACGIVLGLHVKRTIQMHKTTLNPFGSPTTLITSGPFTASRNPMYLSYMLVALAAAIFSETIAGFWGPLLYFLYLNVKTIPLEEKNLRLSFSTVYEAYCKKVRRWI